MRLPAFFDTHWGHLATKPLVALLLYAPLHWWPLHVSALLAALLAIGVPEAVSGVRKQILWPGSMTAAVGWKDLAADGWAAATVVLPLAVAWPLLPRLLLGAAMLVLLVPLNLHRWALP